MLTNFLVILLVFLLSISSVLLIVSNNKIYSILYLIFIYICSSLLFMYLGVSIIGLFYFLVYIGAVAVLFLFSVMILNLRTTNYNYSYYIYSSLALILILLFSHLYYAYELQYIYTNLSGYEYYYTTNELLRLLGISIFKNYEIVLVVCGLILLVAMMGAIHLTNKKKGFFVKKQQYPLARINYLYHVTIY